MKLNKLAFLLILLLSSCGLKDIFDQPEIDTVEPADNASGVSTNTSIEIEYTIPMNERSAEKAFYLFSRTGGTTEQVDGFFKWEKDSSHMIFTPYLPLIYGKAYEIQVTTDAESAEGRNITGTFNSSFTAGVPIGPLTIVNMYPSSNTMLSERRPVVWMQFSSAVSYDQITASVSISPNYEHHLLITNNGLDVYYLPLADLAAGTEYSITVDAVLQDIFGNAMKENVSRNFIIGSEFVPPVLNAVYAGSLLLNQSSVTHGVNKQDSFTFEFSEAMDLKSLQENFIFSDGVIGNFTADVSDSRIVYFTPTAMLSSEAVYMLSVSENAADYSGNTLHQKSVFGICADGITSQIPKVTAIRSESGVLILENDVLDLSGRNFYTNLEIQFSTGMNEASCYAGISVSWIAGLGQQDVLIDRFVYQTNRVLLGLTNLAGQNYYKLIILGGESGLSDTNANTLKKDISLLIRT